MSVLRITSAVPSISSSLGGSLAASVSSSAASASASSSYFSSSCALPFRQRLRGISCFPKLRVKATTELAERRQIMHAKRFPAKSCAAMQSRPLLNVKTKEDLFATLKQETEAKHLPESVISALEELFENYCNAVLEGGKLNANEIVVANMAMTFDRVLLQFEEPYTFSSYHKAIREPFDYYTFGQEYIRPLIDFRNSYVGNIEVFEKIENQLRQGENIILISNHQTEADPAVISLLLEKSNPMIAEEIIYVAGDRVIHDPVCMPFSLGRNLLCVSSKKHINDVPELAEMKKKANTRTLKEMSLLLRKGGQLIWIAPSGGRDRPDPDTMEWVPDKFDEVSLDNMRRLVEYSGVPGHMHPLALLCYELMPPPLQVEREIGEKRKIGFHGVGISIAPEISFSDFANTHTNENEAKKVYANSLYDTVVAQYGVLHSAIYGGKGVSASTDLVKLSQPWEQCIPDLSTA